MDLVSIVCRRRRYGPRTEDSYKLWIRQFIYCYAERHSGILAAPDIEVFLNPLADSLD
jgi:hypothetical protein